MRKVCAWCQQEIDADESTPAASAAPISHGVCPDCFQKFFSFIGKPLRALLDEFPGPVFLVDATNKIITANSEGLALIGREPDAAEEKRLGEVFECPSASQAGGCGSSIHCKTCTIRNAITETSRTGQALLRVPAYADLHFFSRDKKMQFAISTEKIGPAVLLRIDTLA